MDTEHPDAAGLYEEFLKRVHRLPSLESQFMEWFRFLVEHGDRLPTPYHDVCELGRSGFKAYVRSGFWRCNDRAYWGFILAKLEIPPQYRGRGWFRNCIELLYHSMPHDLLVLESVIKKELHAALMKQPAYQLFDRNNFVRWDVAELGEFNATNFSRIDPATFVRLGGKVKLPEYCRPVVNFPGYKPAMTKAKAWADFMSTLSQKQKPSGESISGERNPP